MKNRLPTSVALVFLGCLALAGTQCTAKLADGFDCNAVARAVCERADRCGSLSSQGFDGAKCTDLLAENCSVERAESKGSFSGSTEKALASPRDCAASLEDTACGATVPDCDGAQEFLGCGSGDTASSSSSPSDAACTIAAAALEDGSAQVRCVKDHRSGSYLALTEQTCTATKEACEEAGGHVFVSPPGSCKQWCNRPDNLRLALVGGGDDAFCAEAKCVAQLSPSSSSFKPLTRTQCCSRGLTEACGSSSSPDAGGGDGGGALAIASCSDGKICSEILSGDGAAYAAQCSKQGNQGSTSPCSAAYKGGPACLNATFTANGGQQVKGNFFWTKTYCVETNNTQNTYGTCCDLSGTPTGTHCRNVTSCQ